MRRVAIKTLYILNILMSSILYNCSFSNAVSDKLSLEDAIKITKEKNGFIKKAFIDLEQTQVDYRLALGALWPTLSLEYNYTPNIFQTNNPLILPNDKVSFVAYWELSNSGKKYFKLKRTQLDIERRKNNTLQELRNMLIIVYQNFFGVLKAQRLYQIAAEQENKSKAIYDQIKSQVDAKKALKKDTYQAEVNYLNTRTDTIKSKGELVTQQASLKAAIGFYIDETLPSLVDVTELKACEILISLDKAIEYGLHHRPDLCAQKNDIDIKKLKVLQTKINQRFKISLEATYDHTFGCRNKNGPSACINIQAPLFNGFQSHYNILKTELNLNSCIATYEQDQKNVISEIHAAFQKFETNIAILKSSRRALKLAKFNYNLILKSQADGKTSASDVDTARTSLAVSETNYIIAFYDKLFAEVQLAYVTGSHLPYQEQK